MSNSGEKVIPIWTNGTLPKHVTGDGQLWPLVLKQAIFPAFRISSAKLNLEGRATNICAPKDAGRPFVVLVWSGRHGMAGLRIGLQFTYGGQGQFAFDLSAVRFEGNVRHQTSFYQEYLSGDEPDFATRVLHLCGFGIGLARGMEASPLAGASWRSTVVQMPKWLC